MLKFGTTAQFWGGVVLGIVVLSVAIQSVLVVSEVGAAQAFFNVIKWIGTFEWLREYQTLLTGAAAVGAAWLSVRAVRDQIKSSELAAQKQIDHATWIENNRNEAKHTAVRASTPLTLSDLMDYCSAVLAQLANAHSHCAGHILPKTAPPLAFPTAPTSIVGDLKELIEFSKIEDRRFIWQILVSLQILRSRLDSLRISHLSTSSIVSESNIEAYIVNASDLMARAASYFDYARGFSDAHPAFVTRREVGAAMSSVIWSTSATTIINKYGLTDDTPWEPWTR
ncbi:hypothetical protein [Agrobacterium pusense]|uniref:hypothetical protein n=1 Tax=Agrobacterium pusense TaxID=648995 RepID=UPI00156B26E7|nr:hypothetical protein [Agrobacterium pusense]QKJ90917.1 hypothetical protein HQN82_05910 [Agrobacterium pusense]